MFSADASSSASLLAASKISSRVRKPLPSLSSLLKARLKTICLQGKNVLRLCSVLFEIKKNHSGYAKIIKIFWSYMYIAHIKYFLAFLSTYATVIFFGFYCKCGLFFTNRCMLFAMNQKKRHNVADVAHGSAHVMNEIASVFLDY